jgi:hypothetical protein
MHGYFGWKNPRFEDYEYTSWLPDDDTMAWLGNGNTLAEFTDEGDSTLYMDYSDVSKVLPVPTKDYDPPRTCTSAAVNGDLSDKQHAAPENIDTTAIPNTIVDQKAPAKTQPLANGDTTPPGYPVVSGNSTLLFDGAQSYEFNF